MPYPAGHRNEVKKKIVASARRLFNRHGFDRVSLDQIMEGAGLTRGGFYSYFDSKSDLYAEVLGCFFTDPNWKSCWEGVNVDLQATDVGRQVVRAYLSVQHFEDVENSCPMVALPSDVTRSSATARRIRDRFCRHGQHPRAQHTLAGTRSTLRVPGHGRLVCRWHGRRARHGESPRRRSPPRCLHAGRSVPRWLESKQESL
jgi:AcrR family transcriptional regulator